MAYDTLLGYLNGTLRYGDAPSTIYVAEIKGHPEFIKIGFCQLAFRNQRRADPFINSILYESCQDHDTTNVAGDMPRSEAFLIEQYIHALLTSHRELIPELDEIKWSGRYETFRFSATGRTQFLDWLAYEVSWLRTRGTDSLEQMLDQLVTTAEECELYEELKQNWEAERALRMKRIARARKVKA
jgi:hypothetical protein